MNGVLSDVESRVTKSFCERFARSRSADREFGLALHTSRGRCRVAGAPGSTANVGTFVDVDRSCKCWINMFNI